MYCLDGCHYFIYEEVTARCTTGQLNRLDHNHIPTDKKIQVWIMRYRQCKGNSVFISLYEATLLEACRGT